MSNIILIGFMGSGKSTIGKILADRLERDFVDTDWLIEERTGKSVQQIFAQDGEERFREVEAMVVESVCGRDGLVVSAGGGVVLRPENVVCLRECGTVVYLRLSEQKLVKRTKHLSGRPLLEAEDRLARVKELMEQRRGLYEAAAHVVVDVGTLTPAQVTDAVAKKLEVE